MILDECLAYYHEECCRNALSGNICNYNRKVTLVNHKEIVEVPSDFLGGSHGCENVKLFSRRESRENTWEHRCLDMRCDIKLRTDSFFFRSYL